MRSKLYLLFMPAINIILEQAQTVFDNGYRSGVIFT